MCKSIAVAHGVPWLCIKVGSCDLLDGSASPEQIFDSRSAGDAVRLAVYGSARGGLSCGASDVEQLRRSPA